MSGQVLDAAGRTPGPLTRFEKKWRSDLTGGEYRARYDALQDRRKLPLSDKIALSLEKVREWHEAFGGHVSVSYSGGVDSCVLLWLVRSIFPGTPAVFVHTGLEYPELVRAVNMTPNVEVIRPKTKFREVVRRYGFPLVSKKVSKGISVLRAPTDGNQNVRRLYLSGVNRFGEPVNGFKIADRWRFLLNAPFQVSDKCCEVMKKEPMRRYERRTGRVQFLGLMASDSKGREKAYLQHGCNAYDIKRPHSTPMSFWSKSDVAECIRRHDIPYPDVYGDIVDTDSGPMFSGVESTGCMFCGFGLHLERGETRFQKMYRTHPKIWRICMDGLGMGAALNYCRDHISGALREKFSPVPSGCRQ